MDTYAFNHQRLDLNRGAFALLGVLLIVFLGGCQDLSTEGGNALAAGERLPDITLTPQATSTPVPTTLPLTPESTPTAELVTPTVSPASSVCTNLRGKTERMTFVSQAMGEEVSYLVHFPPCYERYHDRALPVLYLLHGWPMNETHWDVLGADEVADDWLSRGLSGPFLIVMPGVSSDGLYVNSSGGPGSFEGMLTDELVPLIDETYKVWRDPLGRAIGGISRGGVWALEIGLRHPYLFSIVGAHSPALGLNRPLPQYNPFLLVEDNRPGQRFYLDAGDRDWARTSTVRFYELLVEQDADAVYQVHAGNHVDELWHAGIVDYLSFYTATWPRNWEALPLWTAVSETTDMASGMNEITGANP